MGGFGLGSYLRYLKFAYSGWFCDRMTCLIQNGHFVYMDGWSMKYEWSMLNVPPAHGLQLERLRCCTVGRCSRPLSPPSFPSDQPRVEVLHYLQAGHHRPPHMCLRWGRTQEEASDIQVVLEKEFPAIGETKIRSDLWQREHSSKVSRRGQQENNWQKCCLD